MTVADLNIVNYCHSGCKPLCNVMRLPKAQAFALAAKMAEQHKNTTAFYRFADFQNYYPARLKTDKLLRERFITLGGKPTQQHPLSFVLHGSDYLNDWFDNGIVTKFPLSVLDEDSVSFTYGDSMSTVAKRGEITMFTKSMLLKEIADFNGTLDEFLKTVAEQYRYIEVQVWNDDCLGLK